MAKLCPVSLQLGEAWRANNAPSRLAQFQAPSTSGAHLPCGPPALTNDKCGVAPGRGPGPAQILPLSGDGTRNARAAMDGVAISSLGIIPPALSTFVTSATVS